MNKDDILAMSRKENEGKEDEREHRISSDASKFAMSVGGIISVLIALCSRIADIPLLALAAWSVYFSMLGSCRLYQFIKAREKGRLVQAIVGIVFGLACFIGMIVLGLTK